MERCAIVTGVSRGLGEALAVDLLQRGWRVLGIGRHDSPRLAHPSYHFESFDLADARHVDARLAPAFAAAAARAPSAAVLVNNAAGAGPVGVFGALQGADIAASIALNLAAPAALANLFCRSFVDAACDRRIVNVSSGAAVRTLAGGGVYCVAKAGVEMVTRVIADEQGTSTLRAITLRPGIIDTQMQAYMRTQSSDVLPSVDLFQGFHASGQLVAPATVARKTIERLIEGPIDAGRTYSYAEL
jgi:benzil reductase ((S)-benzoin forming)